MPAVQPANGFDQIEAILADPVLSAGLKVVLIAIRNRIRKNPDAWPSMATIAADCGISKVTAKTHVRSLREQHYIEVIHRTGKSNRYRINWSKITPRSEETPVESAPPVDSAPRSEATPHPDRKRTPRGVESAPPGGSKANPIKGKEEVTEKDSEKDRGRGEKKNRLKFDAAKATLPSTLDTPEFLDSWQEWCAYRRKRKPAITEDAFRKQIAKLERVGPAAAIQAIETAIASDWQSLHPEKISRNGSTNGQATDKRVSSAYRYAGDTKDI